MATFPSTPRHVIATLLATICLVGELARGEEPGDDPPPARVKMHIPDVDETDIADCLDFAVDAANKENLDGFLLCFASSARSSIRRQMALFFVRHDVAIDMLDKHFIARNRNRAEMAVNYTTVLTGQEYQIVSTIELVREGDRWVISRESVVSRTVRRSDSFSDSPCGPGGCPPAPCLGGQCGLPNRQLPPLFP